MTANIDKDIKELLALTDNELNYVHHGDRRLIMLRAKRIARRLKKELEKK